jgi:hypothetical protein
MSRKYNRETRADYLFLLSQAKRRKVYGDLFDQSFPNESATQHNQITDENTRETAVIWPTPLPAYESQCNGDYSELLVCVCCKQVVCRLCLPYMVDYQYCNAQPTTKHDVSTEGKAWCTKRCIIKPVQRKSNNIVMSLQYLALKSLYETHQLHRLSDACINLTITHEAKRAIGVKRIQHLLPGMCMLTQCNCNGCDVCHIKVSCNCDE